MKKILSLLLCLLMLASLLPMAAFAADAVDASAGLCEHHKAHNADCGYSAGVKCSHDCKTANEGCVLEVKKDCKHTGHNAACGYVEAVAAVCVHKHDATCGYAEAKCLHTSHNEACGYAPAVPGAECGHVHNEACYTAVTKCIHVCDGSCGYTPAVSGTTCSCGRTDGGHDEGCGYSEGTPASGTCGHVCSAETGCITVQPDCKHKHDEACGFVQAVEEKPCTHNCASSDEGCVVAAECTHVCSAETGCTLGVTGKPCTHDCKTAGENCVLPVEAVCKHPAAHTEACGYKPAVACKFVASPCETCAAAALTATMGISVSPASMSYTGSAVSPNIRVYDKDKTLVPGTHYTLSYRRGDAPTTDLTSVGEITVTAAGMGPVYGSKSASAKFTITAAGVAPTVRLSGNQFLYTGSEITPTAAVYVGGKLLDSSQYVVKYRNNINVGYGFVDVSPSPTGNYSFTTVSVPFAIVSKLNYAVVFGNGNHWHRSNQHGVGFATNGPADKLTGVYIDGIPVPPNLMSYTGDALSTSVWVSSGVLPYLKNGWHGITFAYTDGVANGAFLVGSSYINAPMTGDDGNAGLLAALCMLALTGSVTIAVSLRKRKNEG